MICDRITKGKRQADSGKIHEQTSCLLPLRRRHSKHASFSNNKKYGNVQCFCSGKSITDSESKVFVKGYSYRHSAFHVPKSQTPRRKESVHHKSYLLYKPFGHPFNQETVQVSSSQMLTKSQTYQRVLLNNSLKPAILTLSCTGIMLFQVQII